MRWRWVAPVVGVVVFFGTWQLLVDVLDVPSYEILGPRQILSAIADDPSFYVRNAWVTAQEALLGLAIALVSAMVIASVAALLPFFERAAEPVVVLLQVTPVVAYAPAVVIWLGPGLKPILTITALVCFVPFYFNAVTGLRAVEPATVELLDSVAARRREVFWRLRLPNALPYLFAAGRIAIGLSLIGAVLGEYFALRTDGLGVAIRKAQQFSDYNQLWASIFGLALTGSVMILLLGLLERVLLRWHGPRSTR
jgi:NitT/TauT family transport system permease protein